MYVLVYDGSERYIQIHQEERAVCESVCVQVTERKREHQDFYFVLFFATPWDISFLAYMLSCATFEKHRQFHAQKCGFCKQKSPDDEALKQ